MGLRFRAHELLDLDQLAGFVRSYSVGLIIVDSLSKFWDVRDENDSGQVERGMQPLLALARETGAGLILIHHMRKAEGDGGLRIRGSTALPAAVDIAISFEMRADNARRLQSISRYDETPRSLVVELSKEGSYEALGDDAKLKWQREQRTILEALSDVPKTAEEVAEETALPTGTVRVRLNQLWKELAISRAGDGKKGDPYRYSVPGPPIIIEEE